MSYLQIFSDLSIVNKPLWFEEFTKRYHLPVVPHITFTQARELDEQKAKELIGTMKAALPEYADAFPMKVLAGDMRLDVEDDMLTVMLDVHNDTLMDIQKRMRSILPEGLSFVHPHLEQYEIDFKPHLTIAMYIPLDKKKEVFDHYGLESLALDLVVDAPFAFLSSAYTTESVNDVSNHWKLC